MTTSEPTTAKDMNVPTTGEIVRALREEAKMELGGQAATVHLTTIQNAIDRLESQARELSGITGELELVKEQALADAFDGIRVITGLSDELKALTARAEQAERERDAAINALTEYEDALYPTVEDMMRDLNTL